VRSWERITALGLSSAKKKRPDWRTLALGDGKVDPRCQEDFGINKGGGGKEHAVSSGRRLGEKRHLRTIFGASRMAWIEGGGRFQRIPAEFEGAPLPLRDGAWFSRHSEGSGVGAHIVNFHERISLGLTESLSSGRSYGVCSVPWVKRWDPGMLLS